MRKIYLRNAHSLLAFPVMAFKVLSVVGALLSANVNANSISLSGYGTPTVDGFLDMGEWVSAGTTSFSVGLPDGSTTLGTLSVMNDSVNLYFAVCIDGVSERGSVGFDFDNNNLDGSTQVPGDDAIVYNSESGFFDDVRVGTSLFGFQDIDVGGTVDGGGAFSVVGGATIYELFHPLDSADDANDFSLGAGDIVGFNLHVVMIDSSYPTASTYFPGSPGVPATWGDIHIVPTPAASLLFGTGLAGLFGVARRKKTV